MNQRFEIGERVVCIAVTGPSLIKVGEEYGVLDVAYCPKCGIQAIDVGFVATGANVCQDGHPQVVVSETNQRFYWSGFFAPLNEYTEAETAVRKLLKPEPQTSDYVNDTFEYATKYLNPKK